jgi:hypothetical protein
MNFLNKLIEDTKKGDLDFIWKFNEPDKYTFFAPKDPMNGMNFDLSKEPIIIFPNGFGLLCNKDQLNVLKNEIRLAIERAAIKIMNQYVKYFVSDVGNEEDSSIFKDEEIITVEENILDKK